MRIQTEWAGACSAPDSQTLFVNIYSPASTIAIRGPFAQAEAPVGGPAALRPMLSGSGKALIVRGPVCEDRESAAPPRCVSGPKTRALTPRSRRCRAIRNASQVVAQTRYRKRCPDASDPRQCHELHSIIPDRVIRHCRMKSALAIAVTGLGRPSETFIQNHIEMIAPHNTVVLARGEFTTSVGFPLLAGLDAELDPLPSLARVLRRKLGKLVGGRVGFASDFSLHKQAAVSDYLASHRVGVLLAEYLYNAVPYIEVCQALEIDLFAHAHGFDVMVMPREEKRWQQLYANLFASAKGIVAPSQFIAERLCELGCKSAKIHVIPCGVDLEQFAPAAPMPKRAVAVGRLVPKKAPQLTIRAFARATSALPGAKLEVVGAGDLWDECQTEIDRCGARDRIIMHGAVPHAEVHEVLARSSLFLQHSVTTQSGDTEGLPVGILEAMAMAIPVISTRHSGIPEAVIDGETGLLVEEGDVDAMKQAIETLFAQPDMAKQFGRRGRERAAAKFGLAQTCGRLADIMDLAR